MNILKTLQSIENNELLKTFKELYGTDEAQLEYQRQKVMNRQGSMKLIGVNSEVMEVFEITGFSDILTIE